MRTLSSIMASGLGAMVTATVAGCASSSSAVPNDGVSVRYVPPSEAVPHGSAPGARHRLLASSPDGAKSYVLILQKGDEVASALSSFATAEGVVAAHFTAIGAVRDAEVAWFGLDRKEYKAMRRDARFRNPLAAFRSLTPLTRVHRTAIRNTRYGGLRRSFPPFRPGIRCH